MKLHVEIYKTDTGFCAHSPEVPGCVAAGSDLQETEQLIAEALMLHLNLRKLLRLDFQICA
ncbi:MAG: type II toxin-antitoxin system HicB family antitoxin [Candidatus Eremiobacteraeota bacterium]|nr:type II toxin-antitoxin system HicB family antitoxin [Candidatus Eremiobacteraeota bacterium]